MGIKSSVPIIEHDKKIIQGSLETIDYLDKTFPEHSLTPTDYEQRKEALNWENYLAEEVGVTVRLCVYHILLDHPKIVKPFFTNNGPWYGNLFLSLAFPKLVSKMRYFMKINSESAVLARKQLSAAIDKLAQHYQDNQFLVGDKFSRADLTAASLLAPLSKQPKYGLDWPKELPDELNKLMSEFASKTQWVDRMYDKYR
jgi:glutathione S-transferase